jgi:hypothetical protein
MATPGVNPVAGTKFFIGPAGSVPASPDLFVEVGDISNLGDIAQQFAQVGIERAARCTRSRFSRSTAAM